jgi:hypothetical protein
MLYCKLKGERRKMVLLSPKSRSFLVSMIIAFLTVATLAIITPIDVSASSGWLVGWNYRKSHVINHAAGAGTDYQVRIRTYYEVPVEDTKFSHFVKYDGNPLNVPLEGASGVVHPDVIYFPEGMDGYKYWMAYTPDPPETLEHPCIARSNDGISWTDAGITNPVATQSPSDADPAIIYVSSLAKWFMVYSPYWSPVERIALAYSSDGKNWTLYDGDPVNGNTNPNILSGDDNAAQPWESEGGITKVSEPNLMYESGTFYLHYCTYVGGNNHGKVGLATFTWDDIGNNIQNFQRFSGNPVVALPSDNIFASGCGHADVSRSGSTYYMYVVRALVSSGNFELAMLTSTDKVSWTYQGRVLQRGPSGAWDDEHIYRSCLVTDATGNVIDFSGDTKLYYSAWGNPNIGLATGTSLPLADNGEVCYLNGKCRTDFGDVRFTRSDGVTLLDYWMESKVDSDHATFWVKMADDLSTASQSIYAYYGKSDATNLSDIGAASLWNWGDDFDDNTRNPAQWDAFKLQSSHVGTAAETNQRLELFIGQSATAVGFVSHDPLYAQGFEMSILAHNPTIGEVGFYLHTTKVTDGMSTSNQDCIDVADHCYRIMLYPTGGQCYVQRRVSGIISDLYSGTSSGKENTLKIRVEEDTVRFFEGDAERASESWALPTKNCYVIIEGWGGSTGTDWADSFWIRKYVSPEPSHGVWGSEEQLTTELSVDPFSIEKTYNDIGTTFQANVTITEVTDFQGFDLNLTWDGTLLNLADVDFSSTLNNMWGSGNWYYAKNETGSGYYKLVAVSTAASFNSTGATPLCKLLFLIKDPQSNSMRETLLHFETHKLSDSQSNPIAHLASDGTYRITPRGPSLQVIPRMIEKSSLDVGTTFKMNITIQSIDCLFGFEVNITWDKTMLTFSNCDYENALDTIWGAGKWFLAKNETGLGSYRLVALSTADTFNTTQSQPLFTLEMHVEDVIQPGETSIHFATHKLSDKQANPITHIAEDGTYRFFKTPTLEMNPASRICRMFGETFDVAVDISDAYNTTGFAFEIHYNMTLLDYVAVTWNVWGPGTITVDEAGGNITVSNSGTPISGTQTLITVKFKAAYYHVWKVAPSWTNNLTDVIFFQWANLSYPSGPDLRYERGGSSQINVGPDFAYTFSPIQGDVNNDGTVDIMDLRTVAIYYLVKQGDPEWTQASTYDLNGDGIVDVFDLRTAAWNHGYTYVP